MPRRIPLVVLAAGLVLLASGPAAAVGEVGSAAADFALQDLAGELHTLAAHRGEVVLLAVVGYG